MFWERLFLSTRPLTNCLPVLNLMKACSASPALLTIATFVVSPFSAVPKDKDKDRYKDKDKDKDTLFTITASFFPLCFCCTFPFSSVLARF